MNTKNTLVLGNGFSKAIFKKIPSWAKLFGKKESDKNNNYTILYEVNLLRDESKTDDIYKNEIIDEIRSVDLDKNIKESVLDVDKFGILLFENNINDIITTNYDEGIEIILCKCSYKEVNPKELKKEEIYNIRTYKQFVNKENGHQIKLWKIHGGVDRIKSITLGFDQYCGFLSKLSEYIKGNYISKQGPKCEVPMINKCKNQEFDNLSWVELFFNTNVYIAGLGMDFSEIDVWWLLNKHMRIKREVSQVKNNIYYLYSQYDDKSEKKDVFDTLEAFQVECIKITSDDNYIRNIFDVISNNSKE